jgi:hypothetical protein
MINMMYLVLTALLALNVSAEILNAFKTVDRSLMIASGVAEQKNVEIFKSFKAKLEDPTTREKAAYWEPKAQQAKKISDELYNYIEGLKIVILIFNMGPIKNFKPHRDENIFNLLLNESHWMVTCCLKPFFKDGIS